MRAFVGVVVAAVALGGALAMHNEITETPASSRVPCSRSSLTRAQCNAFGAKVIDGRRYAITSYSEVRPGWVDPLALALAIAGIGCGVVLIAQARKQL